MKFSRVVRDILSSSPNPVTPQEIRDRIKMKYPDLYGTTSHIHNVEKGHYKDIDHALLAQIYTFVGTNKDFCCDKSVKPMKISLAGETKPALQVPIMAYDSVIRKIPSRGTTNWDAKVRDILENAETYHQAYYEAETFLGPSLYFHLRALDTRSEPGSIEHLEYVYATLSSWGMHRMGKGGSKMNDFETFRGSVAPLRNRLCEAQKYHYQEMTEQKWENLKSIFSGINVMASGTSLVGNSKVMHHMLPNIVPPIDREYTLWYLRNSTAIKNDLGYEWHLMREIISKFFIPIATDNTFKGIADKWISDGDNYPWDTSILKLADNLVIGLKKSVDRSPA